MRSILAGALDYLLPRVCCVCGGSCDTDNRLSVPIPEDISICFPCLSSVVPLERERRWYLCLSDPYESDPCPDLTLYLPFAYDSFFSRAIPNIKFRRNRSLARFLGQRLGEIMASDGIICDAIIPVPLSRERYYQRGFNQAEEIARECARIMHKPIMSETLIRKRNTGQQARIEDRMERAANVNGAFGVISSAGIIGRRIILIDDVSTTGHTLHEGAVTLLENGARDVLCVALCGNRGVKNPDL